MKAFVSVDEMRAIDAATIARYGGDSFQLMEAATDAMHEKFCERFLVSDCEVLILCGPGNNGGDGYRLAEKLRLSGFRTFVFAALEPKSKDCRLAEKLYKGARVEQPEQWMGRRRVVVDAVFGVGGKAGLSKELRRVFRKARASGSSRVSVDLPSGVNGDSGSCDEGAFEADLTFCIGYAKNGMLRGEALAQFGEVEFIDVGFERAGGSRFQALEKSDFCFQRRPRSSHKGTFGRLGVVGGSEGMPGAAFLCAEAGHRVGAGYVTLFGAKKSRICLHEATFLYREHWATEDLQKLTALVVGPGGAPRKMPWAKLKMPIVIDADGLSSYVSGQSPKRRSKVGDGGKSKLTPGGDGGRRILTPHPGEAGRLLGLSPREVEADRVSAVLRLRELTGASVYLKGIPGLLAFSPPGTEEVRVDQYGDGGTCYVNLCANPIFAKAGSGDVLSGILGGFLAQKPEAFAESVISALVFQTQVGEVLRGSRAAIASDQLEVFSEAFRRF